MLILAGVGISGSLALIEQAKYTAYANEMKQIEEAVAIYILEKQLESAETGEEIEIFGTPLTPDQLPESLRNEIKYIREMLSGIDVSAMIPSYYANNVLETGEGSNIYYIPPEQANGKEQTYIYDEQSGSVYKVDATIIWGVEMHGYDYGNLLVSRPGLLERAQKKEEIAKGDYVIKNTQEMKAFRDAVNGEDTFEGRTVYLMVDIDLNAGKYEVGEDGTIEFATDAEQWTPIGDYDTNTELKFSGTFKGNNHKISGLYIENDKDFQGLFGYNEGTIQDLIIEQGYIKGTATTSTGATGWVHENILAISGSAHIGGVAGANVGGEIINCTNKITVEGNTFTGGIVGYNSKLTDIESKISNCTNEGNIISVGNGDRKYVGGIAGYNEDIVENCTNNGKIENTGTTSADSNILGGIVSYDVGKVINCKNYGEVTLEGNGSNLFAGGITGGSQGLTDNAYNSGSITNCGSGRYVSSAGITAVSSVVMNSCNEGVIINSGTSTGYSDASLRAGGIAGTTWSLGSTISNSYNRADVSCNGTGKKYVDVGGIVGLSYPSGKVNLCYNTGNITNLASSGTKRTGAISGYNNITITNCYYLSGTASAGIGSGTKTGTTSKPDADMKLQDFVDILNAARGTNTEYLEWTKSDTYPIFKSNESSE